MGHRVPRVTATSPSPLTDVRSSTLKASTFNLAKRFLTSFDVRANTCRFNILSNYPEVLLGTFFVWFFCWQVVDCDVDKKLFARFCSQIKRQQTIISPSQRLFSNQKRPSPGWNDTFGFFFVSRAHSKQRLAKTVLKLVDFNMSFLCKLTQSQLHCSSIAQLHFTFVIRHPNYSKKKNVIF